MKISRKTHSKSAILALIESSNVALSQLEIQNGIKDICDRVTTYRILERLLIEGKLHKIINVDGVLKYANCHTCIEKSSHSHNHVHFSCLSCKIVTCLDDVTPTFVMRKNYKITEMNFTLSGLCPKCF